MLTTRDAAARLDLTPQSVARLCKQGQIRAERIGRDYLISEDELARFAALTRPQGRPRKGTMKTYFSSWGDSEQGETIRQVGNTAHRETWTGGNPSTHELLVDDRAVRLLNAVEQDVIFYHQMRIDHGLHVDPSHLQRWEARGWQTPRRAGISPELPH